MDKVRDKNEILHQLNDPSSIREIKTMLDNFGQSIDIISQEK